jgi:hypothetical protein
VGNLPLVEQLVHMMQRALGQVGSQLWELVEEGEVLAQEAGVEQLPVLVTRLQLAMQPIDSLKHTLHMQGPYS